MSRHKPIIAFLGTDGSGKTTVMNVVVPEIEARLGRKFIVHHLKPDLLLPLGRFRGVKHEKGWVCTNPHGSKPSGFMGSCFRLAYLTVDYVLGYWFKVRIRIKRPEAAGWVFDRYAYDMLIDPLRFRIKLPQRIIRIALSVIPKPDIVICLGGEPSLIHARKPETSLIEVARQMEVLKRLQGSDQRMKWVDTTAPLHETISRVTEILSEINK